MLNARAFLTTSRPPLKPDCFTQAATFSLSSNKFSQFAKCVQPEPLWRGMPGTRYNSTTKVLDILSPPLPGGPYSHSGSDVAVVHVSSPRHHFSYLAVSHTLIPTISFSFTVFIFTAGKQLLPKTCGYSRQKAVTCHRSPTNNFEHKYLRHIQLCIFLFIKWRQQINL